jgi:glycosyltransferase involved in cell wall biosynthesis
LKEIMIAERRLLVVAESLGVGGTETHLIKLLAPLSRGWSIAVFCLSERGQRADQLEAAGISVFSPLQPRKAKLCKHRNPLAILAAANRLFWLMRHWHPHIVHFYLPGPYLVGTPLALATGAPIKIMSRRSLSNYHKHHPLIGRLERRFHRAMDALVGNSQAVVNDLIAEGVPRDKVHLIYNGVTAALDLPDRDVARKAIGLEQNVLVGAVIANLIPYKGHRDLVEGLAAVSQSLPLGWRMLCVGRDEGIQRNLERLAEAHGIKENIQFLGERTDTTAFLAAADFCVLSSLEEGFSNVILEAMAAGLPIVVTSVGGNPEAVTDQEAGLVVPPRDPKALGNAILRLAQDPDLRERLGAAAKRRVKHKFSLENCVESHNRLYEELMSRCLNWADCGS